MRLFPELLVVNFLCLAASEQAALSEIHGALATDDECDVGGGDKAHCAVNALQLRGQMLEEAAANSSSELALSAEEQTAWPTCAKYGCHAKYSRYSVCQCNPNCHRYHNCCPDYYTKCWRLPATQHHSAVPAPVHHAAHHHASSGNAACSAIPQCAALKLGGDCCPTPAGNYLGCCPGSMIPHPTAPPPTILHGRKMMTLYHQTSPDICKLILANNFRIGHGGWCGNAIYFALSPEATKTKAITPHSGSGCMIEAHVDVGHVQSFPCCRYCGGRQDEHIYWTESGLAAKGYNSIEINPGDGPEIVIYNNKQVVSMREVPFKPEWTPHKMHYKE